MVALGIGVVVTSLFMTTLGVVKVRLQSQHPSAKWKKLLYCSGVPEPLTCAQTVPAVPPSFRTHSRLWHYGCPCEDDETRGHQDPVEQSPSHPVAFLFGRALTFDLFGHTVAGALACVGTVTVMCSLELVWPCCGPGRLVISVAGLGPH
ncbi:hypothetical protein GH733_008085 [Mirounga leonina]|nr:hypothetical protein GH733_008085 [Mirounga leonina]